MNDTKPWWQSQTIWASIITVIVGILTATGLITTTMGETITNEAPELIIGLVTTGLGVWAAIGRVRATTKVGSSNKSG